MVSPSEHRALPSVGEIVEGTRTARIAAHVGDTVRRADRREQERQMAVARRNLDWERQFSLAIAGAYARTIHERDGAIETCSMCGDLCAIKIVRELFAECPQGTDKPVTKGKEETEDSGDLPEQDSSLR
jgi:phosphomethylpyrimidine synthase